MGELNLAKLYTEAAAGKFSGDPHISVDLGGEITLDPTLGGAWVPALVFVEEGECEPQPGPTYDVWMAEQYEADKGFDWIWAWEAGYTCSNDPDGKQARTAAHEHAKWLRGQYCCAFVGVYPNGKHPKPIHEDA